MINKKLFRVLVVLLLLTVFPYAALALTDGDDYPLDLVVWDNGVVIRERDSVTDSWGYPNGECTSFAAWCLNSRNGIEFNYLYGGMWWGDASGWAEAAKSIGITVDNTPAVGAILCSGSGSYGHVAWVKKVEGKKVWIDQYNVGYGNYAEEEFENSPGRTYIHISDITDPVVTHYDESLAGTWYLRSAAFEDRRDGYVSIDGNNDADGTAAIITGFDNTTTWHFNLIRTDHILKGYKIIPAASASGRLLNVGSDWVRAGDPVNIFHDTEAYNNGKASTQWWLVERKGGRYIIHNKNNPSRVLTVDGRSLKMMPYQEGDKSQLWEIISDQNDPTQIATYRIEYYRNLSPVNEFLEQSGKDVFEEESKKQFEDYTILDRFPTQKGFYFQGWSTDPKATEPDPQYAPGSAYTRDASLCLYAVWMSSESLEPRSIVLAIDTSGSMRGVPIAETKKAADRFVNRTYGGNAELAIVCFDSNSRVEAGFSTSEEEMHQTISLFNAGGGTNIGSALENANSLLKQSKNKKIIILMSDGYPEDGLQGDDLIALADRIKEEGVIIYTLGFYQNPDDRAKQQELMERLASEGCHYEVDQAENLQFFFSDVSDQIKGERYLYIRIACPVEVEVSYEEETLNSADGERHQRTSFGVLTLEDDPDVPGETIKVLRLHEGPAYDVHIRGTGEGVMNYSMGIMDEDGEYTDFRKFESVPVTESTIIETVADLTTQTSLRVDSDGDGNVDAIYNAVSNSDPIVINRNRILLYGGFVILAVVILLFARAPKKVIRQKSVSERGDFFS